jgi:hypothetical protein
MVLFWILLVVGFRYSLPEMLSGLGLSPLPKYGATTASVLFWTIALWASSTIVGMTRGVIWILANFGVLSGSQYTGYYGVVKNFHIFTVWTLAASTVLAGYLTQWFL